MDSRYNFSGKKETSRRSIKTCERKCGNDAAQLKTMLLNEPLQARSQAKIQEIVSLSCNTSMDQSDFEQIKLFKSKVNAVSPSQINIKCPKKSSLQRDGFYSKKMKHNRNRPRRPKLGASFLEMREKPHNSESVKKNQRSITVRLKPVSINIGLSKSSQKSRNNQSLLPKTRTDFQKHMAKLTTSSKAIPPNCHKNSKRLKSTQKPQSDLFFLTSNLSDVSNLPKKYKYTVFPPEEELSFLKNPLQRSQDLEISQRA
ncbi:unnamed protein product [Moneuplotes crassus]|uniref:Uncharacterized protein n=1 Tax=Euplotes crassus TaxID=5936 RepID=A0AAD1U8L0_EUPCR|nr:unnamed protein product [Moneuplotes crassus]